MYRSTAKRAKQVGTWAVAALAAVGSGVLVAHLSAHATASRPAVSPAINVGASSATLSSLASSSESSRAITVAAPLGVVSPSTVVSVTSRSLTVRSRSGVTSTYGLTPSTVVLSGRQHTTIARVRVGDTVFVVPAASGTSTAGTIGILPSSGGHEREVGSDATNDGALSGDL